MGAHVSQIKQSAVRNRLLASLPPADFRLLAASLKPVTLTLKQFLLEADEPVEAAYFVETGMVSYLAYLGGGSSGGRHHRLRGHGRDAADPWY